MFDYKANPTESSNEIKNSLYGTHQLSRPMRIVDPIQIWRGCVIYLKIIIIIIIIIIFTNLAQRAELVKSDCLGDCLLFTISTFLMSYHKFLARYLLLKFR